jgi:hypothetical protein
MLRAEPAGRKHIKVTCPCGHKQELAARVGDPGHEPGQSFYVICCDCEGVLLVEMPRTEAAAQFTAPWLQRLWQR